MAVLVVPRPARAARSEVCTDGQRVYDSPVGRTRRHIVGTVKLNPEGAVIEGLERSGICREEAVRRLTE
jgi:hypothetical protein